MFLDDEAGNFDRLACGKACEVEGEFHGIKSLAVFFSHLDDFDYVVFESVDVVTVLGEEYVVVADEHNFYSSACNVDIGSEDYADVVFLAFGDGVGRFDVELALPLAVAGIGIGSEGVNTVGVFNGRIFNLTPVFVGPPCGHLGHVGIFPEVVVGVLVDPGNAGFFGLGAHAGEGAGVERVLDDCDFANLDFTCGSTCEVEYEEESVAVDTGEFFTVEDIFLVTGNFFSFSEEEYAVVVGLGEFECSTGEVAAERFNFDRYVVGLVGLSCESGNVDLDLSLPLFGTGSLGVVNGEFVFFYGNFGFKPGAQEDVTAVYVSRNAGVEAR